MSLFRYVLDSSVIIGLRDGGVLDCFLSRMPGLFAIPDIMVDEIELDWLEKKPSPRFDITRMELTSGEVRELIALASAHRALSVCDLAAFLIARRERATLLTGDKDLRQLAEDHCVAVHGILWILDEMVAREVLTPQQAAESLKTMLIKGTWLPMDECRRRVRYWNSLQPQR